MGNLEKAIEKLEAIIDNWEDTDPEYLPSNLRKLRHRIFFVHRVLERSVEILIIKKTSSPFADKISNEERLGLNRSILIILERVSFIRKIEILKDLGVETTKSLYKNLLEVNKIRNEFAHPEAFALRDYEDKEERWKILTLLVEAMEEFNKLFAAIEVNN